VHFSERDQHSSDCAVIKLVAGSLPRLFSVAARFFATIVSPALRGEPSGLRKTWLSPGSLFSFAASISISFARCGLAT
jgi:hypothetical protein